MCESIKPRRIPFAEGKEMRHEYVGISPKLGNRRSGKRGSAPGADAGVSEADDAPRYRPLRACHEDFDEALTEIESLLLRAITGRRMPMAVTKIWAIHDSVSRVVDYCTNPSKTKLSDWSRCCCMLRQRKKPG